MTRGGLVRYHQLDIMWLIGTTGSPVGDAKCVEIPSHLGVVYPTAVGACIDSPAPPCCVRPSRTFAMIQTTRHECAQPGPAMSRQLAALPLPPVSRQNVTVTNYTGAQGYWDIS
jgi:hypothetical protein